jgi:Ca2+-binding RTX toxin-like protein
MRRTIVLLAVMALTLLVASGVALAVAKKCTLNAALCQGTINADILLGTHNADNIKGLGGNDWIEGANGNDTTNGAEGNDTYSYKGEGFHQDILEDVSGVDTVNFSRVANTGMDITLITPPEGSPQANRAFTRTNGNPLFPQGSSVSFGQSVIERAVGTSVSDIIFGGKQANTLMPGPGGQGDQLIDRGGDGTFPASNDTYKGFKSGKCTIQDFGGSADMIDLRPLTSDDVSFDSFEGTDDLIIDAGSVSITVIDHFAGAQYRVEKLVLAETSYTL